MSLYVVMGRVCDREDHVKIVKALTCEDAERKFEIHVRDLEGTETKASDFYVEHCMPLDDMKNSMIV